MYLLFKLITYLLVPLGIWSYLYFRNKKDSSPKINKLINTLGSTLLIFGLTAFLLDYLEKLVSMSINVKMSIIMIIGFSWAIYFYFFFSKKKAK